MKPIQSRIIQGVVMPEGWHYEFDVTNNSKLRLTADTLPDLVVTVTKYRLDNLLPIGDPLADIENYVCGRFPKQCHSVIGATATVEVEQVTTKDEKRSLLDRIINWFEAQMTKLDANQLVLPFDAIRRASICEKCPANQNFDVGCHSCRDNIDRLSMIIRSGNRLTRDKKLKGCSVLGHENRSAVWLRKERLGASDKLPDNCWIRNEGQ